MFNSKIKKVYLKNRNKITDCRACFCRHIHEKPQNHLQPDLVFLAFEQNTPKTYFTNSNDELLFNHIKNQTDKNPVLVR